MTSEEDSPSSNPSSADFRRLLAPLRLGRPKDAPSATTPLSLAQARDSQPAPLLLPALPQTIDRFILLERLGEGGMGVVFAAYDPKLDRKVALKLIHEVRREDGERRQRMEREAQAMAKLSHPNVVTVYEVGDFETRLYLVMEFVKGSDLRGWLTQRAGTVGWRVILETFIQAGNGLAAAHKAGLVHRDFKPDNVFVGEDGRVRVGDFGLARQDLAADAEMTQMRERACAGAGPALFAQELTVTGVALGTPAYMAPEQFTGDPTDTRTDQFSFCAALWEALYGTRPFAGATLAELVDNVIEGRKTPPPPGREVPPWVRKVLDRGLAVTAESRYPSMEALLEALRADPTLRRRVLAAVACITLATGGWLGVEAYNQARQGEACVAEGASISDVWNDDVRSKLRAGLLATGVSYAETTAQKVLSYFDAQAGTWQAARTEACLDAHVRGRWSDDLLDRATWCLDERRIDFESMIAELTTTDEESIQYAVAAAAAMSQVEPCRDARRLAMLPPLPSERGAMHSITSKMASVSALAAGHKYEEAEAGAAEAVAAAEAFEWAPLVAAARLQHGDVLERVGKYPEAKVVLEEAYFQAAAVGALETAADAAVLLGYTTGGGEGLREEGLRWSRHAELIFTQLGEADDRLRRAIAYNVLATIHSMSGSYEKAKVLHEQALAILEKALGPNHPTVTSTLLCIARLDNSMGRFTAAAEITERAVATQEAAFGDDHPEVAEALIHLANAQGSLGAYAKARAASQRALSIQQQTLAPDHPYVAISYNNLGAVTYQLGEYAEAIALHEHGLDIRERTLGPEHLHVANSLNNLAAVHRAMAHDEVAKTFHERALVIGRKTAADHLEVAKAISGIALYHAEIEEFARANELMKQALEMLAQKLGAEHPRVGEAHFRLGEVLVSTGDYADAKIHMERALAIREETLGPEHPDIATSLSGLAGIPGAMDPADAQAMRARALAIREDTLGPAHPDVAASLMDLAEDRMLTGAHESAREFYERALTIRYRSLGVDHPKVAETLVGLSNCARMQGRFIAAIQLASRAVQIQEAHPKPTKLGIGRVALARALWDAPPDQGRDRSRAAALARQAGETGTPLGILGAHSAR